MNAEAKKVAIVTGGSRGIGAAISLRLAAENYAVVINYASDSARAEALVQDIENAGGVARSSQGDVADPTAVTQLFDYAEATFGRVDVLVNAAGVMPVGPLAQMSDADIGRLIDVNLKGSTHTMREAARRMRDGGSIVNFSSSVTSLLQPTLSVYGATKAAIEAMTAILAKELGGKGIRVNAVAPGPVATEFLKHSPQEVLDLLVHMTPLGRLGEPDDIAGVVAFLVGDDGRWVNGQTLRVNGGII